MKSSWQQISVYLYIQDLEIISCTAYMCLKGNSTVYTNDNSAKKPKTLWDIIWVITQSQWCHQRFHCFVLRLQTFNRELVVLWTGDVGVCCQESLVKNAMEHYEKCLSEAWPTLKSEKSVYLSFCCLNLLITLNFIEKRLIAGLIYYYIEYTIHSGLQVFTTTVMLFLQGVNRAWSCL